MNDWTGSAAQRKPQLVCECPPAFRGNQRYISSAESRRHVRRRVESPVPSPPLSDDSGAFEIVDGTMPIGVHAGKRLDEIPPTYLSSFVHNVTGQPAIVDAFMKELERRKDS